LYGNEGLEYCVHQEFFRSNNTKEVLRKMNVL
jgi:hypothetical protein